MSGDTDETDTWHRQFAISLFNLAWELIQKPDRTEDDNVEMLLASAASRWHWGRVGDSDQLATGDWQVAHVASLLQFGELALMFASRNMAIAKENGWDGWRLASAHEGMARAYGLLGNSDARDREISAAEAALAREDDEEEREIIGGQLATVPR